MPSAPMRALIVDKPLVCQRGSPGRLSSHCAAYGGPVFRRCALRVLAPPALRASNGQRPGRECIFTANASICSAKNARNDVHAVISDLSLVLPILCQCSEGCERTFVVLSQPFYRLAAYGLRRKSFGGLRVYRRKNRTSPRWLRGSSPAYTRAMVFLRARMQRVISA